MIGPLVEVKIWYGYGLGSLKVTRTVSGSLASTLTTPSTIWVVLAAVFGSATYCQVNTTSSAVNGDPSDHLMPGLSFHVMLFWSLATPPLSRVGISAARTAIGLPSGPEAASGSRMSREASWSLVPWARCTFRVVGACQYRIFSWPPTPRPPAVVAGLVVAAIVGAGAAGAVVGWAAAGAVVAAAAGAVVGLAAGAVVAAGAAGAAVGLGVAAGPHAAASNNVHADRT